MSTIWTVESIRQRIHELLSDRTGVKVRSMSDGAQLGLHLAFSHRLNQGGNYEELRQALESTFDIKIPNDRIPQEKNLPKIRVYEIIYLIFELLPTDRKLETPRQVQY